MRSKALPVCTKGVKVFRFAFYKHIDIFNLRPLQISADFETALFEVCAYLPDFCVPDERDLRFASTGLNFGTLVKLQRYPRNIQYIHPKGIYYAAPVVDPPEADRFSCMRAYNM